jgi:hypothetical protein
MNDFLLFLSLLLAGYGISTIAFLTSSLFLKKFRTRKNAYLNIANLLALFISLAVTYYFVTNYINNPEPTVSYRTKFFTSLSLSGIVPLLFLSYRLRTSIFVTIVVVIIINWIQFNETVYNWIDNLYPEPFFSGGGGQAGVSFQNPILLLIVITLFYFTTVFLFSYCTKNERLTERL